MHVPGTLGSDTFAAQARAFEVATRAANLGERLRTVAALPGAAGDEPLSGLDAWRLKRQADRLAEVGTGDLAAEALLEALAAHRRLERRSSRPARDEQAVLTAVHATWLPTYTAALDGHDAGEPSPSWVAAACAPFLGLLHRELTAYAAGLSGPPCSEPVAAAFATLLAERFELAVTWAVEADQRTAFARLGLTASGATEADHEAYRLRTFGDAAACHGFYVRFPLLARWLAVAPRQLLDDGVRVLGRLVADADAVGTELLGAPIRAFTSLTLGRSDPHTGGRSVAMIDVALDRGAAGFVYKPRDLGAERAMQGLIAQLADDGALSLAGRRVLVRDGYGYEQRLPTDLTAVATPAEAARVYEEMGGLLAIFHVLGGTDLHHENVIVAGGHAYVCDCETVLGVLAPGQVPASGTVLDSVYRTGLLEWPLPASADVGVRTSACQGGESYAMPVPVPRLQPGPAPAIRQLTDVRVEQRATNRVVLDGRLVDPQDFAASIASGFAAVHDWFRRTPDAGRHMTALFAEADVRLVARHTQLYAQLLAACHHPQCLADPLEADLLFARLEDEPLRWDRSGAALAGERRALWQLDIPLFTVPAVGTAVVNDHAAPAGVELDRSPLELARERIERLSEDDRERQLGYIAASLAVGEVRTPTFVATALDHAALIGTDLAARIGPGGAPPRWTRQDGEPVPAHLGGSLYYGSAGVALFLAYLDARRPDPGLRRGAERALAHALDRPPDGPGAFEGLAGHVYVLIHLAELWDEPALRDRAIALAARVDAMVGGSEPFDVLDGDAGVIAVMLALDATTGHGLGTAHRCARRLLEHAEGAGTLSWPLENRAFAIANPTGFAHGAAGIGWALIRLGAATAREEYVEAGRRAFAYERLHFDVDDRNWYDLRTSVVELAGGRRHYANAWCSGAAGIGLSRLASWDALGGDDDELLDEAHVALAATMRSFAHLGNDTLCHGRCGNAELLLRFASATGDPTYDIEAGVHAQAHWRRLALEPDWPRTSEGRPTLSGLLAGTAGIGMHFLRLAAPERVPSALVLDPPPPKEDVA